MYQAALNSGGSMVSKKISLCPCVCVCVHVRVCAHVHARACVCVCVLATRSCPTLCDPMDCSLPGSSVWHSPGKSTGVGLPFPSPGPALE